MTKELQIFLATIYGEAANSSVASQRAIASCIMNRVGKREWKRWVTPLQIIAMTGFDAFSHENTPYLKAMDHLSKHTEPMGALGRLKDAVLPIYEGREPTIPDLVLYYSPQAQAFLHKKNPKVWRALPPWNFKLLDRMWIPGTEADDFAWFKYKVRA